tara:strand:+ start:130 stop:303 length:174 start_codon:yes stop_codon:yes gene_type:complete
MNSQFIHSLDMLDKEKKLPNLKKPLNAMEPPKKKRKEPSEIFEKFTKKNNISKKKNK